MGKFLDLTGMKFNKWTVESRDYTKTTYGARWNCICECGNKATVISSYLIKGKSKSCLKCSKIAQGKRNRKLTIEKILFNKKVGKVAHQRNIEIKMNEFDYCKIASNNCYYCGQEPLEFKPYSDSDSIFVNGVDRIDSNKPYEISNCVPCCKACNFAKNDQPIDEFITRVKRIYENFIKK